MSNHKKLNYRDAGVDIEAGDKLADSIAKIAATDNPGVLGGIGGFGSIFDLRAAGFKDPLLVSATDGVGTKLLLAENLGSMDTIGIDLVAMCANDVLALGATPLFFLDYLACGKLEPATAAVIVSSINDGCRLAGMALVGGESAEMPGLYPAGRYDLAGFCVGAVERGKIVDGKAITAGDHIIAIASDGAHANGYSLVRRIMQLQNIDQSEPETWPQQIAKLLTPTRIYTKSVLPLVNDNLVHGIAHITGGGLPGNIPRILPTDTDAVLDNKTWQWPQLFTWLQQHGDVATGEMLRTFNCGVGMVLVTAAKDSNAVITRLAASGEKAWLLGKVEQGTKTVRWQNN